MTYELLAFELLGVEFDFHRLDAVGAGTILLAIATFALAWITLRQLKRAKDDHDIANKALAASQKQADIAEKTLQSQIRPVLIEVPIDIDHSVRLRFPGDSVGVERTVGEVLLEEETPTSGPLEVRCAIPYRNAGRGIAQIEAAWIEVDGQGYSAADLTRPNLPAGEETWALFRFREGEDSYALVQARIQQRDDVVAAIRYSDIAGRQVTTTTLTLSYQEQPDHRWAVAYIKVGEPDSGDVPPPGAIGPSRV